MMKHYYLNFFLILAVVISSCTPYHNSAYFQGLDRNSGISHKIDNYSPLTIQPADILSLNVKSLNAEASAMFNTDASSSSASGGSSTSSATSTPSGGGSGYLVDKNGEIDLPLVHKLKVAGMTIEEVQNAIQKAIAQYFKDITLTVHLMNFKITIIGDVEKPDIYSIENDRISIPQALSLAGDVTPSAKRDNILLIREINGQRQYVNIDITSSKLFDSPYYYMKNNDMLYVEEGRGKFINVNPVKQTLPYFLTFLSLCLIAFEVIRNYHL
jgi:polysaccharide export outer membrane protein